MRPLWPNGWIFLYYDGWKYSFNQIIEPEVPFGFVVEETIRFMVDETISLIIEKIYDSWKHVFNSDEHL